MQQHQENVRVLVVGDLGRTEFRQAATWLENHAALTIVPDLTRARDHLRDSEEPPTLIVLPQPHPGQYRSAEVESLRQLAPLSPIVALLGNWCEGEVISGHPCAGVFRIFWYQFQPRLGTDTERFLQGKCPLWGLPPTAPSDQHWLKLSQFPLKPRQGLIAVHADDRQTASTLMDVCESVGYATVWVRSGQRITLRGVMACLWDAPTSRRPPIEGARRLWQHMGPVPLVALLGFPRVSDMCQLQNAGVAALLAKPYLIDELLWQLDRVIQSAAKRPRGTRPAA